MQAIGLRLDISSISHTHLCPRRILGVRIGLAGMIALGFREPPAKKQLLLISETDVIGIVFEQIVGISANDPPDKKSGVRCHSPNARFCVFYALRPRRDSNPRSRP